MISTLGVGSGLDLNGILGQLEAAERQQLVPMLRQKAGVQSQLTAFGSLKGALSGLQSAMEKLSDAATFAPVKSGVTGEAVTAASGDGSALGVYNVNVTNIAKAYSVTTDGIAAKDTNLGAATLTFNKANGDVVTLDVTNSKSSLEEIRDGINGLGEGIQASIVNDGSGTPYRLAISSSDTGTDAAISSIDFGALNGTLNLDLATEIAGENAALTVNGVNITSQSNQVEEAIEGVTLSIAELGTATVEVERDDAQIVGEIKKFVEKYNEFNSTVKSLRKFDSETGKAGSLLGNSSLQSVETGIRGVFNGGIAESSFTLLGDIGISKELDGSLKIDEEALGEIVEKDLGNLVEFFTGVDGEGGLASALDEKLESMLDSGGLIETAKDGLEVTLDRIGDSQAQIEKRIASTISRYRTQFSKLDIAVANMNAAGNQLFAQLSSLDAQFGGGKD
jgi:flagellar hook-associated protein 2